MQERYLGDSHDFLKYALLRHLHACLGLRLGVNWYLTKTEHVDKAGNQDGEKRHHLKGGAWRDSDPILFEKITILDDPQNRLLGNVARLGILPKNTIYHDQLLSASDRSGWHNDATSQLGLSDLVFLDPDNGFEVPSMTKRSAPKYATYKEAAAYFRNGKAVIGIQFARQCDPIQRAHDVRSKLAEACEYSGRLPVIRGRLAPNLLFISVVPAALETGFGDALHSFVGKFPKAELIP